MDYLIPFKEINIFGSFSWRIFYPLMNSKKVVILVVFNGINYYEVSIRMFIPIWKINIMKIFIRDNLSLKGLLLKGLVIKWR